MMPTCAFSRVFHRLHDFPRVEKTARFPALGKTFHVFPRFLPVTQFPVFGKHCKIFRAFYQRHIVGWSGSSSDRLISLFDVIGQVGNSGSVCDVVT